jgi:glutamyl endopeptidase
MYGLLSQEVSGVIGRDTRVRINDTTVAPFKYICQIRIGNTFERPHDVGTGFLIGPRTVMTAAHVVYGQQVGQIFIVPGRNGLSKNPDPFEKYGATDFILSHPAYSTVDNGTGKDYAIIHLHEEVPSELGHWGMKPWKGDQTGSSFLASKYLPESAGIQKINLCGYPRDKGGDTQYVSYDKRLRFNKSRTELFFLNDIAKRNSGSPIWVRRSSDNGGRVLVGICIAIQPNKAGTKADFNVGVFMTDEVRKFMSDNTL